MAPTFSPLVSGIQNLSTKELLVSTAYHEAGHTIVSLMCGILPDYVEVKFDEKSERWDGVTALPKLDGETREKVINLFAICFGGLFSQAKHRVSQICPNEAVPYRELLKWASQGSSQPLEILLECGELLSIPTWWFQGGDLDQFQYLSSEVINSLGTNDYLATIQKAVRDKAIPILEREWDKVVSLAADLEGSVDGRTGRIHAEKLSDMLSQDRIALD